MTLTARRSLLPGCAAPPRTGCAHPIDHPDPEVRALAAADPAFGADRLNRLLDAAFAASAPPLVPVPPSPEQPNPS